MDFWILLNNSIKPCSVHQKKFLDSLLQPISKSQKSYVSLKRQMWKTEYSCFDGRLESRHKPQNEGIKITWKAYKNFYEDNRIPTHNLPERLRLILKENFFQFNGKHYLQTHGTAMGTKKAVFFANIFMAYIETTTLSETVFKSTVWKCYIDYIFPYVNPRSKPSLNKQTYITQLLNSRQKHLTLRLCFRHGCIQRHKIQEKINPWCKDILNKRKPSCTHKKGFVKGEALRILWKNSSETTFGGNNSNFKKRLMDREKPTNFDIDPLNS